MMISLSLSHFSAKALAPYITVVDGGDWNQVDDFFNKMNNLSNEEIMETMFDNDAWQAFVESGFYPYNQGLLFILIFKLDQKETLHKNRFCNTVDIKIIKAMGINIIYFYL